MSIEPFELCVSHLKSTDDIAAIAEGCCDDLVHNPLRKHLVNFGVQGKRLSNC